MKEHDRFLDLPLPVKEYIALSHAVANEEIDPKVRCELKDKQVGILFNMTPSEVHSMGEYFDWRNKQVLCQARGRLRWLNSLHS